MKNKFKFMCKELFKERVLSPYKRYYTYLYMYDYEICGNLDERNIEEIEKILFLSNNDVLEKYNTPMLRYKIFISEDRIYLKYLSDLLRVMPVMDRGGEPFGKDVREGRKYGYAKIIKYYSKLSNEELDKAIKEKLMKNKFNEKYIIKGQGKSILMRMVARHNAWVVYNLSVPLGLIKGALGWVTIALVSSWLVYILALCLIPLNIHMGILDLNIMELIVGSFVFVIPWILWTLKIVKPTKFEIENNYVND